MKQQKTYARNFKRKQNRLTNYRKRLKLIVSSLPRLVVRKSNKNITAQIVKYAPDGDLVVLGANSRQLAKLGWNHSRKNLPAAYLTGLLLGKRAAGQKIKKIILDAGFHPSVKGSRIYAVVKGLQDSGVDVPASESIMPSPERLFGNHIIEYFSKKAAGQFAKRSPADLKKDLEGLKKKIMELS